MTKHKCPFCGCSCNCWDYDELMDFGCSHCDDYPNDYNLEDLREWKEQHNGTSNE